MLVRAVAGVDDVGADALAEELGGARGLVADDDHVDPHRLEVARRVDQRLALATPTSRAAATFTVSAREALLGELEGDARARRRLEEEVDDRLAAQRRHLLDRPLGDFLERLGGVEDRGGSASRESGSSPSRSLPSGRAHVRPSARRQIRPRRRHRAPRRAHRPARRAGVVTVRPTMSAWIGSSRPPRSTSTQSRIRARPAEVGELVERRADRAAGVEHVVDDDHRRAVEVRRQAASRRRPGAARPSAGRRDRA